jgi:hypothetical protein
MSSVSQPTTLRLTQTQNYAYSIYSKIQSMRFFAIVNDVTERLSSVYLVPNQFYLRVIADYDYFKVQLVDRGNFILFSLNLDCSKEHQSELEYLTDDNDNLAVIHDILLEKFISVVNATDNECLENGLIKISRSKISKVLSDTLNDFLEDY